METAFSYHSQIDTEPELLEQPLARGENSPMLSIILPTRNEAGNIHLLLTRIEKATKGIPTQVVFVDDSTDETPAVIREIAGRFSLNTTLIVRTPEERHDGLGGAVVRGLRTAQAPWVCIMDADLQHPPEIIPQMLDRANQANADLVLASRRALSSNERGLNPARRFISRSLDKTARLLFPANLRHISDPLTGFFLARRDAIDVDRLAPRGFKILMEILIRFPRLRVSEVPFDFGVRHAGKSKASATEVGRYLSLLWTLRFGGNSVQFVKFAAVGLSGILVNTLALAIVTDWLGVYFMISTMFATVASTVWNFALTEIWVFSTQRQSGMLRRFFLFFVMNNAALAMRGPIMYGLTVWLGVYYVLSNVISLGILTILRYLLADSWIWGKNKKTSDAELAKKKAVAVVTVQNLPGNRS